METVLRHTKVTFTHDWRFRLQCKKLHGEHQDACEDTNQSLDVECRIQPISDVCSKAILHGLEKLLCTLVSFSRQWRLDFSAKISLLNSKRTMRRIHLRRESLEWPEHGYALFLSNTVSQCLLTTASTHSRRFYAMQIALESRNSGKNLGLMTS